MAASSNGAEQSPQEKEIVARLFSRVSQGHGAIHYRVKVRLNRERKIHVQ